MFQPHLCHMNHQVQHTTMSARWYKGRQTFTPGICTRTSLNMATLTQILVVVLAAVALADGFAVRKPENVRREKRQATTEYPSYDTTYNYGTTSSPWNYDTSTGGYPWQDFTTYSPYQTTNYDYWNNYYTTYSPWRYDTTNYDYWNNYYTTYNPWRYDTTYDYWNNYYTTYNPWRYETPYNDWNYYYTTYNPWNRWNRYDSWSTQSPNRDNQEVLLEALADDVVAEAREVVNGAEETLQKANDLEDAVFRANGEEGPRVHDYPILY